MAMQFVINGIRALSAGRTTKFWVATRKNSTVAINDSSRSIFDQKSWRTIVGGTKGYRENVVFKGDVPIARMAHSLKRERWVGIPWGLCPPLSCRNGPVFSDTLTDAEKSKALHLMLRSARIWHPFTSFVFTCDPTAKDAALIRTEFIRANFRHARPINPVCHPDQPGLMTAQPGDNSAVNKRRSHIKNARRKLHIVDDVSPEEFLRFYNSNLLARGKTLNLNEPATVHELLIEGLKHKQVRILGAIPKNQDPSTSDRAFDAAIALACDRPIPGEAPASENINRKQGDRCYLLLLTYRPASVSPETAKPISDANKVLIMEAADFASRNGMIFDTGGWATEGAAKFYRQLFPSKESGEFLDIFEDIKWHARWYEKRKLALKEIVARHGITQIRFSKYNVRIVWLKFIRPLMTRLREWLLGAAFRKRTPSNETLPIPPPSG